MIKVISIAILVTIAAFGFIMYVNQNPSAPDTSDLTLEASPSATFNNPFGEQQGQQAQQQQLQQPGNVSPSPNVASASTVASSASAAIIKTVHGDIKLQLYSKDAPNTVQNFVQKSESNYYENLTFHRVEDWVVQGGDPKGNGTGGGDMPTEINDKPFVVGSLGVARGGNKAISNDSQFFITTKDASWLNGEYTNFGIVTEGMDIVQKIKIGDKILGITIQYQ